jgi:cytochrome b involved in lipid metabolism
MRLTLNKELIFGLVSVFILSVLLTVQVMNYKSPSVTPITPSKALQADPTARLTNDVISKHSSAGDCWIIINNKVYEVTSFLSRHPGGGGLITPYCAKDATEPFNSKGGRGISHSATAMRLLGLIYLGDVNGKISNKPDTKAVQSVPVGENEDEEYDE